MKKKKIKSLIFGISGQDGSYLSHFLINKGYDVCGTTRNSSKNNLKNLVRLGILKKVKIIKCNIIDFLAVKKLIKIIKPDEIYYLCGKSSVTQSFTNPVDSFKSNTLGLLNILDTVKKTNKKIKVFNAVTRAYPFKDFSTDDFDSLLDFLVEVKQIRLQDDFISQGARSRIYFHGNLSLIPDEITKSVKDVSTQKIIGRLDERFTIDLKAGDKIIFRGSPWVILDTDEEVSVAPSKSIGELPRWIG